MGEENSLTAVWKCRCSEINPIFRKSCPSCGRAMPGRVSRRLYREELRSQRYIYNTPARERSERRLKRVDALLNEYKIIAIAVFSVIFILFMLLQILLGGQDVAANTRSYLRSRPDRIKNEINLESDYSGIKSFRTGALKLAGNGVGLFHDFKDWLLNNEHGLRHRLNRNNLNKLREKITIRIRR